MLKAAFVLDTYEPRGSSVATYLRRQAEKVEFIDLAQNPEVIDELLADFERKLREKLERREAVMVVMNYVAAIHLKVLETLRVVEAELDYGTRRIIVSCNTDGHIKKRFRKAGLSRKGTRHVRFDEGAGYYLRDFEGLFL